MKQNIILRHDRLRKIPVSFTWLDHRLWRDGYLASLGATELRLYMFLLLVGDRHGVSYWGDRSTCAQLKIREEQLRISRRRLVEMSLIAYRRPYYQVLSLEEVQRVGDRSRASRVEGVIQDVLAGYRQPRGVRSNK